MGIPGRLVLDGEAVTFLLVASVRLRLQGFAATVAWSRRRARARGARPAEARILASTTARWARRLRLPCLPEAVALCAMLGRRGKDPALRFGVRTGALRAGARPLLAHAWVEFEGAPVTAAPLPPDLVPLVPAAGR